MTSLFSIASMRRPHASLFLCMSLISLKNSFLPIISTRNLFNSSERILLVSSNSCSFRSTELSHLTIIKPKAAVIAESMTVTIPSSILTLKIKNMSIRNPTLLVRVPYFINILLQNGVKYYSPLPRLETSVRVRPPRTTG